MIAKKEPFVRLIFCDAVAADAGYLAPEDIAGCVEVTGRGGTMLQPGIDMLLNARAFSGIRLGSHYYGRRDWAI